MMVPALRLAFATSILTLALVGGVAAQDAGAAPSPILTVDSERVFGTSGIGDRITRELEAELETLAAENRQIEAALGTEEQELTTKRAAVEPGEFRVLADAFDQKVQLIRAEQDAKQRSLQARRDAERQTFIERIGPILSSIGRERGAVVILERRSVVLSAESIDITDEVVARINATLPGGDGTDGQASDTLDPQVPAPELTPPTELPVPE